MHHRHGNYCPLTLGTEDLALAAFVLGEMYNADPHGERTPFLFVKVEKLWTLMQLFI